MRQVQFVRSTGAIAKRDDEWHESNELGSTHFSSYSQTSKTRLYDYPPPLPHSSHSWRSFIYDTEGCAA